MSRERSGSQRALAGLTLTQQGEADRNRPESELKTDFHANLMAGL